jgi:hypothetical protein
MLHSTENDNDEKQIRTLPLSENPVYQDLGGPVQYC